MGERTRKIAEVTCDRCGETNEEEDGRARFSGWGIVSGHFRTGDKLFPQSASGQLDLCAACAKFLRNWILPVPKDAPYVG